MAKKKAAKAQAQRNREQRRARRSASSGRRRGSRGGAGGGIDSRAGVVAHPPAAAPPPALPADPRAFEQALAALGGAVGRYCANPELLEAQTLMYEAFEASGRRRVALARRALEISPDCADAYLLLAEETARDLHEARDLLEQAVAVGKRALGPEPFAEDAGHFWGLIETRPYMRARAALAEALWALGRREEAVAHNAELLRLNPGDNQGVRYRQALWLVALGRLDELDRLYADYPDDAGAGFAYTRALAAFRHGGDCAEARGLLADAAELNPHIPTYLSGRRPIPRRLPSYIGFGDESEAIDYAVAAVPVWAHVAGALDWVEAAAPQNEPELARAARARR